MKNNIPIRPIKYDDCEQFIVQCVCGKVMDSRAFNGKCDKCGQLLDVNADDRCVWKLNNNNGNFSYTTDCKSTTFAYNFMQTYKFCPYCGKPILVEDNLQK